MVTGQCGGAVLAAGELRNVDEHKNQIMPINLIYFWLIRYEFDISTHIEEVWLSFANTKDTLQFDPFEVKSFSGRACISSLWRGKRAFSYDQGEDIFKKKSHKNYAKGGGYGDWIPSHLLSRAGSTWLACSPTTGTPRKGIGVKICHLQVGCTFLGPKSWLC